MKSIWTKNTTKITILCTRYIENCRENIFVIHVKGNIETLSLPGNFEMSIIFFLLSYQFFLYKILSVEFETDLGYSLQMQN